MASTNISKQLIVSIFNCKNIQTNGIEINALFDNLDIVILQNNLLKDYELQMLAVSILTFMQKGYLL